MVVKLLNLWTYMLLNNLYCKQYVFLPPPYQQDKILRNRIIDASFSKLPRNSHNPSNKNGMSTLNFILTSVPLR